MELPRSRVLKLVRMAVACVAGFCTGLPIAQAVLSAFPDGRGRAFLLIALALMLVSVWLWLEYVERARRGDPEMRKG